MTKSNNIKEYTEKEKKESYHFHGKFGSDNIFRKIHCHYLSFIKNYVNHFIKIFLPGDNHFFIELNYKYKIEIDKNVFNQRKNLSIGEILRTPPTKKNKRSEKIKYDISHNEKVFEYITNKSEALKQILNTTYIQLFMNVYAYPLFHFLPPKKTNEIKEKYKFPKEIQFFDDLLNKISKDEFSNNRKYEKRIIEICLKKFR